MVPAVTGFSTDRSPHAARCTVIPAGAKRRAGTHAWVGVRMGPDSVGIGLGLGSRVRGNDGLVWAWVPAFAGMTG